MPDNIEEKVGLQFCYWKINNKLHQPEKAGSYGMNVNDINEFFVNERCVGGKTKNPQSTIAQARWAYIYQVFFSSIQHKPESEITENLWGNLNGGPEEISKYALGTSYKQGANLVFQPSEGSYYYGFKQRIELFSKTPGTGFFFFVIPFTDPKISYAYFKGSEEIKRYGENANLTIMFHGYNFDENFRYKAKVYLLESSEASGLTTTEQFEDKNLWDAPVEKNLDAHDSSTDSNMYIRHNFNINVDWKKDQDGNKEFTVAVEVYRAPYTGRNSEKWERFHCRNFLAEPTSDLVSYDTELLKLEDVDKKASTSSRFIVSDELMSDYLVRINEERTEQIQYIGDINYTRREYDPCGYSKITVKDKADTEREPLIIFDENQPPNQIDKTSQIFTVIAGDDRKDISIALDNLTTKDQFCQGLLLEDGKKHTERKNVFQVEKVYSAVRNKDGFPTTKDETHQEQQRNAGVATTDENKNDSDVSRTNSSYNPSSVQQWKDGVDYAIVSDSEITLKLRYLYNKTEYSNLAVNLLWMFRYFDLSENLAQTFFLPISTCRYPNQIAKFKVYPDIEWEIAFLVTIGAGYSGKLRYERNRQNGYYRDSQRNFGFKYLKDDLNINVTQSSNLGWSIMGKCAVNGKEHSLGFEGIKRSVDLLVSTFNLSRQALEVLNPEGTNPANSAAVIKKVIEIDFVIDPPNIGFALSKKFGEASTKEIVPIYKGGFRADPFIGITISVDLVPLISKIPYVGIVVDLLIKAIEYLTNSDIYITFEAGLAVKFDFTLNYNKIDGLDGKKDAVQVVTIEVPISIKAGCKSNDVVFVPTVTRGGVTETTEMEKWKVEGKVSTTFTFIKTYGYDKTVGKQYEQSKGIWNPAEITIQCYSLVTSKISGSPTKVYKKKLFDEKTLFDNPKAYTDEPN